MTRLVAVIGLGLLLSGCAYYGPGYGYGPGYYSYGPGYYNSGSYPGANGRERTASPGSTFGG